MPKFMILYNSDTKASEQMAQSTPAEMKAGMDAWIKWRDGLDESLQFEFGLPLQAVAQVTASGVGDSDSQVSGYSIIEGESQEAVIESQKNHPHLNQSGNSIEVLEMLLMPGM